MQRQRDVSSSDDDYDDFDLGDGIERNRRVHLPGGNQSSFDDLMHSAQQGVSSIRRSLKRRKTTNRKRGPSRTKVCVSYYLLPEASEIPRLTRSDPLIETHHRANYGYPSRSNKRVSCEENLDEIQFQEFLHSLYPHIDQNLTFQVSKMTTSRQLVEVIPAVPASLYKFKGTVILTLKHGTDARPAPPEPTVPQPQPRRQRPQPTPRNIPESPTEASTHGTDARPAPPEPTVPQPRRQRSQPTTTSTPRNIPERREFPTGTPTVSFNLPTQGNPEAIRVLTEDVVRDDDSNDDVEIVEVEDVPPVGEAVLSDHGHHEVASMETTSLRIQQDMQYAESLALDSERVAEQQQAIIRRRLNRQERARRRQQQKEQLEEDKARILASVETEPTEGVTISFRLPNSSTNRLFSPASTCKVLYNYIYGSTPLVKFSLRNHGEEVPNDDTKMVDAGLTVNTALTVVDLDETANDEETSDEEDLNTTVEDQSSESPLLKIHSLADLKSRCENIRDALLPTKIIKLNRKDIFQELLDSYILNKSLVHHHIRFQIEGEEAVDINGVTREVFTIFFQQLMDKFDGETEKVPSLDHRLLFNSFYEVIGSIMSHCFVLVGYFPPRLCKATAMAMICGEVTDALVFKSFSLYVSEAERQAIDSATQDFTDLATRMRLLALFSRLDCREMPKTHADVERVAIAVARTSLICKPLFCTAKMSSGLNCYPLLWQNVDSAVMDELFDSMKPTPATILQLLTYESTPIEGVDSVLMSVLEERVKGYLEEYIVSLSEEKLVRLLQFWTAADVIVVQALHVSFNSLEGALLRPIANTCIAQLQLSRNYVSRQEFFENMGSYLSCEQAQKFDSI